MLASDWQNPLWKYDVDDDGSLSPLDALVVINKLNRADPNLSFLDPVGLNPYYDTDGDFSLSPLDALTVINGINQSVGGVVASSNLLADTGVSNSDRITNNPVLVGSFEAQSGLSYSAKARLDRGAVVDVTIDSSHRIFFDPTTSGQVLDGDRDAKILVVGTDGSVGITRLAFRLDTIAPVLSSVSLFPADDTGVSNIDGITRLSNPRIFVAGSEGDFLTVRLGDRLEYQGQTDGNLILPSNAGTDGLFRLEVVANDLAGNSSTKTSDIVIDTVVPPATPLQLSAASDSGVVGDKITEYARVMFQGTAEPGTFARVAPSVMRSLAAANGSIFIPNVVLSEGSNPIVFEFTDIAGNRSTFSSVYQRTGQTTQRNPVLYWNEQAIESIRLDATIPAIATRNLAMMSIAVFDVVQSIQGTPNLLVSLPQPEDVLIDAAISTAAFEVLKHLYPAQNSRLSAAQVSYLEDYPDSPSKADSIFFGKQVAEAVISLRSTDGWDRYEDYIASDVLGAWKPTSPMFDVAQAPHWGLLEPFAISDLSIFELKGPPSLDSQDYARDFQEVKSLGSAISVTRASEQKQIARFWSDGAGTYTPPGHWNKIASEVATEQRISVAEAARLFAMLNTALADSSIAVWKTKYEFESWRPITAIRNAESDTNDATVEQADWTPLLITPPHPEYVSGHSTYSNAAATILTDYFGDGYAFKTTSLGLPGVERNFGSFEQASTEAGRSRIFGGIHFEFSNRDGQELGRSVAGQTLGRFRTSEDLKPPTFVFDAFVSGTAKDQNPVIQGWVFDNLSGVETVSVQVDNGQWAPLTLDSRGRFAFQTDFALDSTEDGLHHIRFIARDFAGWISNQETFTFRLDTVAPTIQWKNPLDGKPLYADESIEATVSGTGSDLVWLSYRVDTAGQETRPETPIHFPVEGGAVRTQIDLSGLSIGSHTLIFSATDAAGLTKSVSTGFQLNDLIPLEISGYFPAPESRDIGSTFRPQVIFSRPVISASLDSQSLYATDTTGAIIPAKVVPSADGLFAWLFFDSPMPSASTITVFVNGDRIRGLDGIRLDADRDGTAGGTSSFQFSTVSLDSLANTSIRGRVIDPGADLKMMTYDDILAGPDGVSHTSDDLFLNPISNAKVFVLGQETRAVYTDSQGYFKLDSIPSGTVKLAIDGRTAQGVPLGVFFPEMVMSLDVSVGIENTIMGSMGTQEERQANIYRPEVYLPRLQRSSLQAVGDEPITTITVDAESAPYLSPEQRSRLSLDVPGDSLVNQDGEILINSQIGISTVPPELVRDMLPAGLLQHTFDVTIQAPDAVAFNRPLRMTFPNVFNAPSGSKLNFLSFDHTTGMLVIEGTATVSTDGQSVVTDPGMGITKPGWHGLTPPGNCFEAGISRTERIASNAASALGGLASLLNNVNSVMHDIDAAYDPITPTPVPKVFSQIMDLVDIASSMVDAVQAFRRGDTLTATSSVGSALLTTAVFIGDIAKATNPYFIGLKLFTYAINFTGIFRAFAKPAKGMEQEVLRIRCRQRTVVEPTDWSLGISDGFRIALEMAQQQSIILRDFQNKVLEIRDLLTKVDADIDNLGFTSTDFENMDRLVTEYQALVDQVGEMFYTRAESIYNELRIRFPNISSTNTGSTTGNPDPIVVIDEPKCPIYWRADYLGQTIRGRGHIEFFVPPNVQVTLRAFDPLRNRYAEVVATSSPNTNPTFVGIWQRDWKPIPQSLDSDHDRLPDTIEDIVGTSKWKLDSDADGVSDYLELQNCQDPISGTVLTTGTIARLSALAGESNAIEIVSNPLSSRETIAFLTTGSYGLAIVDITNPIAPKIVSQLKLDGNAFDLAIAPDRSIVAVATDSQGIYIVDITRQSQPRVIKNIQALADQIELHDGVIYAAERTELVSYDLRTGEKIESISVGVHRIESLAIDRSVLYTISEQGLLQSIDVSTGSMVKKGALQMPFSGNLLIANGIAYVSRQRNGLGGFATADVSVLDDLQLISDADAPNIVGKDLSLNGSGLAITVGNSVGDFLHVVDASDPSRTDRFQSQFRLNSSPIALAIAGGVAYVATGKSGLQVINYLASDTQDQAPSVSFKILNRDVDPSKEGYQVIEGQTIEFEGLVSDDVQVSGVELIENGHVIASDVSYPFVFSVLAPRVAQGSSSTSATYRMLATDTGGNSSVSEPIEVQAVVDKLAPQLTLTKPSSKQQVFYVPSIDLQFDEEIDISNLQYSGFILTYLGIDGELGGKDDQLIELRSIQTRILGTKLKLIPFEVLSAGNYRLVVSPAMIVDTSGNQAVDPIQLNFTVRSASGLSALSGIPRFEHLPSANPGQLIRLDVQGIQSDTLIAFPVRDMAGNVSLKPIVPEFVDPETQIGYYQVPREATTGEISVPGDPNGPFLLQIVPVISGVDIEGLQGSLATVALRGLGFSEGDGIYRFGNTQVIDPDSGTDLVNVLFENFLNDFARLSLPLSADVFGAVTVTTQGGTSAPFVQPLRNLNSTAIVGSPLDPTLASANPGQSITFSGDRLTTSTDFISSYQNSLGDTVWTLINPSFVNADGTSAEIQVPLRFNASSLWSSLGSAFKPTLQVVPRALAATIVAPGRVRIDGYGFQEGPSSQYQVGAMDFRDPDISGNLVDVVSLRDADNDTVFAVLPNHGFGPLSIQTSGGTAVLGINWLKPSISGSIYDVAFDQTDLWILDSGVIKRVSLQDGSTLGTYTPLANLSSGGLQVLPASVILSGIDVPAGSLLVTTPNGDVHAVSRQDGLLIASLNVAPNLNAVGGVYAPATGFLYLLDSHSDQVVVIRPSDGQELGRWSAGDDVSNGSLALDPAGNSLWIAGGSTGKILQMSFQGTQIKQLDAQAQNVQGAITGIDFDNSERMLVATLANVVFNVDANSTTSSNSPELISLQAKAIDGIATFSDMASANAAQWIEIRGQNLVRGTRVEFPIADGQGNSTLTWIGIELTSEDGSRGWLRLPANIATGSVRILGDLTSTSVPLQIVPQVFSIDGRLGSNSVSTLYGSGFIEGAMSLASGGIEFFDRATNDQQNDSFTGILIDGDVSGQSNNVYRFILRDAVDGEFRVKTSGGSYTFNNSASNSLSSSALLVNSIVSLSETGVPENRDLASAHPGQTIRINGRGFTSQTLVRFPSADDSGASGFLTRKGIPKDGGRTLEVVIPGRAVSGDILVIGSDTKLPLQIVPRIDGVGGELDARRTILLAGVGFSSELANPLQITIGGLSANVLGLETFSNESATAESPMQYLQVQVPNGATSDSEIKVFSWGGGSAKLKTGVVLAQVPDLLQTEDAGGSIDTATAIPLAINRKVNLTGAVIGDHPSGPFDVDYYSIQLLRGDTVTLYARGRGSLQQSTLDPYIQVFDPNGALLTGDNSSGANGIDALLSFVGQSDGSYWIAVGGQWDSQGEYMLNIARRSADHLMAGSIRSTTTLGTPTISSVASAINGQTITIQVLESGLDMDTKILFTAANGNGGLYTRTVDVTAVSSDGKSVQVAVPHDAITGPVRLFGERAGILLQLVPTIESLRLNGGTGFNSGVLKIEGSGFVEGRIQILYSNQQVSDLSYSESPIDVEPGNNVLHTFVPSWASHGPISVQTLGGISQPFNVRLTGISTVAATGTPRSPDIPSANPGQTIRLTGFGFSLMNQLIFRSKDSDGRISQSIVNPSFVSQDRTQMDVVVPKQATTGVVQLIGDASGQHIQLQIVPVISGVDIEGLQGSLATVALRGLGFSEGDGIYRFGNTQVIDPDSGTDLVNVLFENFLNDFARLSLPLSADVFGAVTVTTQGGTSAPFVQPLRNLNSTAIVGSPLDPTLASANPGQSITFSGDRLTTSTDFISSYQNSLGDTVWTLINPSFVNADGTSAEIQVPLRFNASSLWSSLGSAFKPTLQVVPRALAATIVAPGRVRIDGYGFQEGPSSQYQVGAMDFRDPDISGNLVDVVSLRDADNDTVFAVLPNHGFGPLSIQTSGGTAVLGINWLKPSISGSIYDVAFDQTDLWILDSGVIKRVSLQDGSTLGTYTPLANLSSGGLQVLPASVILSGIDVPAGSLLVTTPNGDVHAVSRQDGLLIASLNVAPNLNAVGGVYAPATGFLYLLDSHSDQVVVIRPSDGQELGRWSAGDDVSNGSLALDPAGNSLWIAGGSTGKILQMSFQGTQIKQLDAQAQNVQGAITGIDFDNSERMLVATLANVVFNVDTSLSPLRIESTTATDGLIGKLDRPTPLQIEGLRNQALAFWSYAGLPESWIQRLASVDIQVAGLSAGILGLASTQIIILDDDAAGFGWYHNCPDHANRVGFDLLSVLLHEMGHVLGLEDLEDPDDRTLMHSSLSMFETRRPTAQDADKAFANLGQARL